MFQITFDLLTNAFSVGITTIAYELNSLQNNVLFCELKKKNDNPFQTAQKEFLFDKIWLQKILS